jgi:hypothetical protein
MTSVATGQIRSNSPLSRFGYGEIEDKNYSLGDALNGAVTGLRSEEQLNLANPASLTALDSMSFVFELGLSANSYQFTENGKSEFAHNSGLDYLSFAFPVTSFWRTGAGLSVYSNNGYAFQTVRYIGADTLTSNIQGSGGIKQVYWSNGFEVVKGLSLGVNAYYLWGQNERYSTTLYQNRDNQNPIGSFSNLAQKLNVLQTKGLVYSFGIQYQYLLAQNKSINLGATFAPAQTLSYRESKMISTIYVNRDTIDNKGLTTDLPMSLAFGMSLQKKDHYLLSADVEAVQWKGLSIYGIDNQFNNSLRLSLGGEYLPEKYSMNFFKRVKYRTGLKLENMHWTVLDAQNNTVSYTNLSLSAGFGIPFKQTRNTLNVSAELGKHFASSTEALTDQYLLVKINITLFDKWFHKRKID